jgi:hypothetical protein
MSWSIGKCQCGESTHGQAMFCYAGQGNVKVCIGLRDLRMDKGLPSEYIKVEAPLYTDSYPFSSSPTAVPPI